MSFLTFIETYWTYLTIPVISAAVGYGTNWLAVKMMFMPVNFVGFGPIGWQGVIPANAPKMGSTLVDTSVRNTLDQDELLSRIDSDELFEVVRHRLDPLVEDIVDEALEKTRILGFSITNVFWKASPASLKNQVYREVRKQLPTIIADVTEDIKNDLDTFIDIHEMALERLLMHKTLLSDVFEKVAGKEFIFLRNSGFYFGFPLGLPVMVLWYFYPVWWLLPLSGMLVGYLTNFLAIEMLQKPVKPKKILGITFHGLFLKRQKEVSNKLAEVFATKLINGQVLFEAINSKRDSCEKVDQIISREVNHTIETTQGVIKPLVYFSVGSREYDLMRERVCQRVLSESHKIDPKSLNYIDKTMDIESTMATRMNDMPPEEFWGILHPIVSEDQWKLIAVGAVLGTIAGTMQWLLLT